MTDENLFCSTKQRCTAVLEHKQSSKLFRRIRMEDRNWQAGQGSS